MGIFAGSIKWRLGLAFVLAVLLFEVALLLAACFGRWRRLWTALDCFDRWLPRLRLLALPLFVLLLAVFPLLVMGPWGDRILLLCERLTVLWTLSLAGAICLRALAPKRSGAELLTLSVIAVAVAVRLALFIPYVTTYPFSLDYSEGARYYYASLFFAPSLYGMSVPLSSLHPSRYLLQSIPFLIAGLPLWAHRLWQVLLWLGLTAGAGLALAKRLAIPGRLLQTAVAGWAFLFLFQGPVYYHLLVCVILVLWGFDRRRLGWTLGVVLVASAWAGLSRLNWYPMPGLLAAALYLLEETPRQSGFRLWRYLLAPAAWVVLGVLTALASASAYIALSGNEPSAFGTSLTSGLLWYRLLPNPTYSLGVLPGTLLVSVPLWLVLVFGRRGQPGRYRPISLVGLGAILAVLFAGGLVVSVKIGGGGNLHNMDAYMVLLMVIASYAYVGGAQETAVPGPPAFQHLIWLAALAIVVPLSFLVSETQPLRPRDFPRAERGLEAVRAAVAETVDQGGEILFISQRHLLTFHMVEGVTLIPEYERVTLVEMAMAGNLEYLTRFYTDLRRGRFALIVGEGMTTEHRRLVYPYYEEDNLWAERISRYVLETYQPVETLSGLGISLYVPIELPDSDPCGCSRAP
jgi:hypothetical protein